jgi:hypothetical protein
MCFSIQQGKVLKDLLKLPNFHLCFKELSSDGANCLVKTLVDPKSYFQLQNPLSQSSDSKSQEMSPLKAKIEIGLISKHN